MSNKYAYFALILIFVCVVLCHFCNKPKPFPNIESIPDTIEVISLFRDTAKIEVVKWKTVLKQGRDRIIHDTLKCDSVYTLALKQDTLIKIDSILITKYIDLNEANNKVIDSLRKDKKGRWKAFKIGFGTGFLVGAGGAMMIK